MILEGILRLLFWLVGLIIDVIPDMSGIDPLSDYSTDLTVFIDFLAYGFLVFPFSLFLIFIGNVLIWLAVQMVWAFIEWFYKKIPGVN